MNSTREAAPGRRAWPRPRLQQSPFLYAAEFLGEAKLDPDTTGMLP